MRLQASITHSYTALGQRFVSTEPGDGRFSHVYDDAARLKYLVNPESQRTSYLYDAASRVTAQKLANGARASYTHDDDSRLTRLANITSGNVTLSSFDYKYDSVGNRTRVLEADGSRVTWTYDNLYRLARAHRTGTTPYHLTHTYDPVGNRQVNIDGGARTTTVYDAANQIRRYTDSGGITTHTYDATGNLSVVRSPTNQRTTHTWDAENRMTLVKLPSGTRNTMTYEGGGLRTQKQDSTGTSKFIWDGQNILAETDGSNVIQVVYTQAPNVYGNLISQRRSSTTKYYHFDALGSTDRLSDSSQTITDTAIYDPWGKIKASSGSTVNPFRFVGLQGYFYDLDLLEYYLRARFYDPVSGRFLSPDPLDASENGYDHADGNPVMDIDPSGLLARGSLPPVWTPQYTSSRGMGFVAPQGVQYGGATIYSPFAPPSGGTGGSYFPPPESIFEAPVCNDSLGPCGGAPEIEPPEGCTFGRSFKIKSHFISGLGSGDQFLWKRGTAMVLNPSSGSHFGLAAMLICAPSGDTPMVPRRPPPAPLPLNPLEDYGPKCGVGMAEPWDPKKGEPSHSAAFCKAATDWVGGNVHRRKCCLSDPREISALIDRTGAVIFS